MLGEADLNLCEFGDKDFKSLKLKLKNCQDENAFIEVALRGKPVEEANMRSSVRTNVQTNSDIVLM